MASSHKGPVGKAERHLDGLMARLVSDGLVREGIYSTSEGPGGVGMQAVIPTDGIPDRDALGKLLERIAFESLRMRVSILFEGIVGDGDVFLWVNSEPGYHTNWG